MDHTPTCCIYIQGLAPAALPSNHHNHPSQQMEAVTKTSARGAKGKVAMVYSKYVKPQSNSAVSITHQLKPSPVGAAASGSYMDDIDERASAFILAVRERFKNEHNM
ncbi:hypothetical protein GQ55_5G037000 [Panicum hallii var. hallii]|uniref:Uncharacterized protein n=1 Tax=Panicum hallii var. hallii TaxID=1504633 RepID=A0A2T7DCC8_9POAL|nr:hypothetical protein GQ55_5G037000 [Panicum hallii var. hallii]